MELCWSVPWNLCGASNVKSRRCGIARVNPTPSTRHLQDAGSAREDRRHVRRRVEHRVPHFGEEHARDREHRDAAVLELRLAVLDHLGRAGALGEAQRVEVEARVRDARDFIAREAVGELRRRRVLQRGDVELGGGLGRGRRNERGRGGSESESGQELHGCCLCLMPARGRGGELRCHCNRVVRSWCRYGRVMQSRRSSDRVVASRWLSHGEFKFAVAAVGTRSPLKRGAPALSCSAKASHGARGDHVLRRHPHRACSRIDATAFASERPKTLRRFVRAPGFESGAMAASEA